MSELTLMADEAQRKHLDAMRRAVPVTRMVDYGVPLGDALSIHLASSAPDAAEWHLLCEALALKHEEHALLSERDGHAQTAANAWRATYALLQCAQLAFNHDTPDKKALYQRSHLAMLRLAQLRPEINLVNIKTAQGRLFGWTVAPEHSRPLGAVLIMGGLSGWGGVYLDMGIALARRGIVAILAEGPGQGMSRMQEGVYLNAATELGWTSFLEVAQTLCEGSIGVWGNSFGGLFAARLAITDSRIQAVCINGAPLIPEVPPYRTPREQMYALFGCNEDEQLENNLRSLRLRLGVDITDAAMLIVEGGADPLLERGAQADFLSITRSRDTSTFTWIDGEHTIYNYAQERNDRIADWFVSRLK